MPPPATPSDAIPPSQSEKAKFEASQLPKSSHNLLDIWESVKKDALAPAGNSLIVEPLNVGANVVNGLSSVGNWCYDKVTGQKTAAYQIGKMSEFSVGEDTGLAKVSHQVFNMAGSFLAYAVAGKVAGGALRRTGELMPLEAEIANLQVGRYTRSIAQDARVANVLGAGVYAGLRDPNQGESRLSNAASTMVGFAAFEVGNARLVSPGAPLAFKLGQRYLVGAYGGAAQVQAASLIHDHRLADSEQTAGGALGGGLLNALMPQGRRAIEGLTENHLIKGLPHVTDGVSRLHTEALGSMPAGARPRPGSWADVKAIDLVNQAARADLRTKIKLSDDGPTRIDQSRNIVYQRKSDSPLSLIQELAHRRIYRDPRFEQQFRTNARDIHSTDVNDPRNQKAINGYVQTRLSQEVEARSEQNAAAQKLGVPERVSVDPHVISGIEGYGGRFELEARDFIRSGGQSRPGVDHSTGVEKGAADEVTGRVRSSPDLAIVGGTDLATGDSQARADISVKSEKSLGQPADLNVVAGKDMLDPAKRLEIERARIERWSELAGHIKSLNNGPTDQPQNKLYEIIRQRLNSPETGLAKKGWTVLPTQTGSPLDQIGCDYAMVNTRTHEVIILDATQNPEKLANPSAKNVSRYRMEGLIGFDQHLIDPLSGNLKTDYDGVIGRRATSFQEDLDHQLMSLAANGSSITTDMLPSYLKQASPSESQTQIERFRQNLIAKADAASQSSPDHLLLLEYADDLKHGAQRHNEFMAMTVESPPLAENIAKAADKVVLDYVLAKMRIKDPPSLRSDNPEVKMRKDGHLVVSHDGTIYDGGHVQQSVADARTRLRGNKQLLATMLQRDKAVLRKMTQQGWDINTMVKKVQESLVESREVDNGLLGTTDLGLAAGVRNRIANGNMEEMVTGRKPQEVRPAGDALPKQPTELSFTPQQQSEISKLASSMSEFNLEVRDGVDSKDLVAFLEMYRDESTSETARELCDQYLAESFKPPGEQKFIPRLNGAIVAAQINAARANGLTLETGPVRSIVRPGSPDGAPEVFEHR